MAGDRGSDRLRVGCGRRDQHVVGVGVDEPGDFDVDRGVHRLRDHDRRDLHVDDGLDVDQRININRYRYDSHRPHEYFRHNVVEHRSWVRCHCQQQRRSAHQYDRITDIDGSGLGHHQWR
jgi:hypothetical protein